MFCLMQLSTSSLYYSNSNRTILINSTGKDERMKINAKLIVFSFINVHIQYKCA